MLMSHLDVLGELLVDKVGEVTSIVEDHVQGLAIGEDEGLLNAPDVLLISLSLPSVHGHSNGGDGCGCVVLGGEYNHINEFLFIFLIKENMRG